MNKTGYPVKWEEKTYFLSELTAGVKQDFCKWVLLNIVGNIRDMLPQSFWNEELEAVYAKPPRWTITATKGVAALLDEEEGKLQLIRLLFGLQPDEMSYDELKRLTTTKWADKSSDYAVAMATIWGTSDPKAGKGESGSPPLTPTESSTPNSATIPSG